MEVGGVSTPAAATAACVPPPRLVRAAHEFEAQMMKELLKPLTEGDGLTGGEADSDSGSAGALGGFASEALGMAVSEHGGLGVARSILHSLSHSGTASCPATAPGVVQKETK
jgi:hypothetical protein